MEENKTISTGGYVGIMLLLCIPVVGLIVAIIWALGGCKKVNKRNFARAFLILSCVGFIISFILGFVIKGLMEKVPFVGNPTVITEITEGLEGLDGMDTTEILENLEGADITEMMEMLEEVQGIEGLEVLEDLNPADIMKIVGELDAEDINEITQMLEGLGDFQLELPE